MAETPTIFLSYSWANIVIANEIDEDFQITCITLRRDIRGVTCKGNIKEFMKTIIAHDFVVVMISNEFLHSANCMYEIMELLNDEQYKEKILPILVKDKEGNNPKIFDVKDRVDIIKYWNKKKEGTLELLKGVNPVEAISVQDDLKHFTNICENIDNFLGYLKDTNCLDFDTMKIDGYKPIFELIDYDPKDTEKLKQLIKIIDIEDEEQQEIELEEYLEENPIDYRGWFAKGFISSSLGKYKKSKISYERS